MLADSELRGDLRLIGIVSNALVDANGGVREKALQLIQTNPSLVSNAAIEESLHELLRLKTTSDRQREIANGACGVPRQIQRGGCDGRPSRSGLL